MQNGYAGHRLRLLGEAERGAVEGNTCTRLGTSMLIETVMVIGPSAA